MTTVLPCGPTVFPFPGSALSCCLAPRTGQYGILQPRYPTLHILYTFHGHCTPRSFLSGLPTAPSAPPPGWMVFHVSFATSAYSVPLRLGTSPRCGVPCAVPLRGN